MVIKLTQFVDLVNGEITLKEFVNSTPNTIDDTVLQAATTALLTINANKSLINLALDWINAPFTVASTPNPNGTVVAADDCPDELKLIEGLWDLKAVLHDCCPDGDCDYGS